MEQDTGGSPPQAQEAGDGRLHRRRQGRLRAAQRLMAEALAETDAEFAGLRAAVAENPLNAAAALRLAQRLIEIGHFTRAVATLEEALAAGRWIRKLHRRGGMLLLAMGDFDRADAWLERGGRGRKADPALEQARRAAREGVQRDRALGLGPKDKRRLLRALELLVRGRPGEAEPRFAALAGRVPGLARAWLGWRGALEASGRREEAMALARSWAKASPAAVPAIPYAMARRLSPRGLVFDPREPIPVREAGETMAEVATPEALDAGGDRIWTLDPGGEPWVIDPVIPLRAAGSQQTRFAYRTAPRFVAAIEGAALVGRGVVLNLHGEAAAETRPPSDPAKFGFRPFKGHLVPDPGRFFGGACEVRVFDTPAVLMTGPANTSFGDWILNFPPRLALAAAAGLDLPIVVGKETPPAFLQMLELMGVDRRRLLFHDPEGVSLFPRLYAPSWPLPGRDTPMQDLFGIYRGMPAPKAAPGRERLYLSREGAARRRLVNEPEVRALFERRGFRCVHLQTQGLDEARELFASAAVIAGPYGSAFLNVVHAPRPPLAFALMPPEPKGYLNEIALWLGGGGARFSYLFGEAAPPEGWRVPLAQAEAALDEFLTAA